ncbi:MAG: hypothetical protein RIR66_190 [Actinomycetota bacterium]|jgi:phage repressor protein C with HTH and peptisase S24 domain
MGIGLAIIQGHSMIPSYAPGEVVLVKYGTTFNVGDAVLIKFTHRTDIKRVKELLGNRVVVQGDNEAVSIDSRNYGPVKNDLIIGKVIYRFPRWLRIGRKD